MGKVSFPPVSVMYHAAATTLQNSSPKFRNFVWYCTWTRPYHILQQILLNYNKKKDHHHADTFQEKQYY